MKKELVKQFIRDLYYLETIEPQSHVFERISIIIKKWEDYLNDRTII